jgi:hypothetical protein
MIGKKTSGSGFRGLATYLLRDGRGQIVAGPMAGRTPRELAREFGAFRRLNPRLGKAVSHFSLSPSPNDPKLSESQWKLIAERFMSEMGFSTAAWCGVIHRDTDHEHIHLIACRIDENGKTISDANDFRRTEKVLRKIELDFGLSVIASSKTKKLPELSQQPDPSSVGENIMFNTPIPPNPFDPSHPQFATWPDPFEPGRDLAELGFIATTDRITTSGARNPDAVSPKELREVRRDIVDDIYWTQMHAVFGNELTRVFKHAGGAVLYFQGNGRIADLGHRMEALGVMDDIVAAERLVNMAINPPKCWTKISFTGSNNFILCAMREARKHHLNIIPTDENQRKILAQVIAEERGETGITAGPTLPKDPIMAILDELDDISEPDFPMPRPNPLLAPQENKPIPVIPAFLNLRERIQLMRKTKQQPKSNDSEPIQQKRPKSP